MKFLGGPINGQEHDGLVGREALVPQHEGRVVVGHDEYGFPLYDYPVHVYALDASIGTYVYRGLRAPSEAMKPASTRRKG